MRIRPVAALSGALLALGIALAPAASAGNVDYGLSMTRLGNGELWTKIRTGNIEQPDGSLYWELFDTYKKTGGGTISAYMGFNYNGHSYNNSYFTQASGTEHQEGFYQLGFNNCNQIVGWMAVDGQGTFYNAPVSICDGS
ncbi:hypothetical protein IPZ70_18740 [Streptomyces polychromogenes]|nr:hypothetical protein [Streptomyces polychromogenes]